MCVVARVFLGLFHTRREHSPVEILMALDHGSTTTSGKHARVKEQEVARLRYRLREDGGGNAKFVPERGDG